MMAFRVRVLHWLVLSLIGLSFVLYSSFYGNPVQVYHIEPGAQHEDQGINATDVVPPQAEPGPMSSIEQAAQPTHSVESAPSVAKLAQPSSNVQAIPRKTELLNSNVTIDKTSKGILTSSIYEAGHDIPNAELCPELGGRMRLFIAVTSAPEHNAARMAVRQTWGHYGQRRDVGIGFMLGATKSAETDAAVRAEAETYGDIVRARFTDSYDNLTLKTVSILEWVDNYCSRIRFVLKTDDDMFINVPKLLEFVEKHWKAEKTVFGRLAKRWRPIRNKKSKYFVSVLQFAPPVFPDFTTGPAYLITGDVIHDLYKHALKQTYLKLEDVFTTGIVTQAINVKRVHVNEFLNKRVTLNACNIKRGISIHMVKFHEQFDMWKKMLDGRSKCKSKR